MIIGVCGLGHTGSGLVYDYLKEFSDVTIFPNDFELSISYLPGGLEDLEHALNSPYRRYFVSQYAIRSFEQLVDNCSKSSLRKKSSYEIAMNGRFKDISYSYIDSLTDLKWMGYDSLSVYCASSDIDRVLAIIKRRILLSLEKYGIDNAYLRRNLSTYFNCAAHKDSFVSLTQDYISSLLTAAGLNLENTIVLNQPFSGNDPANSMKFFRDSKCILVIRDPRDIYISIKKYYPYMKGSFIPASDVNEFVKYYKSYMRYNKSILSDPRCMVVSMEDCVLNYDNTFKQIDAFLGINKHVNRMKEFNPAISIGNVGVFIRDRQYEHDISIIETELKEDLYDFSNYDVTTASKPFSK